MKQVYKTDQIAHLWAHKTQSSARNQQGNFYFDGDTIYSYGTHFPIARHVINRQGHAGVLFTMDKHSVTTSGHISLVRSSLRDHTATILHVPQVSHADLASTLTAFEQSIDDARKQCFGKSGRFRPTKWTALSDLVGQANAFAEFFDSRKRWTMPADTEAVRLQIERAERAAERKRKADHKRSLITEAQRNARLVDNLERWKAGEDVPYYDLPRLDTAALRVNGDQVETSQGASVPVEDARRGLLFVRRCRDSHTPYQRNGHTLYLGHYPIDKVDADGNLRAGCHRISIEEIERIAPMLEA